MSMIGRTISHYRIVERLGGGGMGVVYRAEDTKLDRSVAIKFLPPQWVDDPEAKDRFVREAKAASALDHPNICTIYEIGETDDGQLFLAMAYYEGQTLKRRLEDGPLPIADAVEIVRQLAEGLAKTHLRDILHRDIKPPNVFLTPEGQVKLLDFGLAKIIGEGVTLTGMTQGTPAYMAPELIRGERATPQTDLWSLGVLLYESLVGQRPFGGRSIPSIVHAVHTGEPRPVRLLRPEVPATLERITARLLAKDPRDRYTSCRELLDDLAVVDVGASTESGSRSFGPISAASFSRPGSGALPSDLQHGTRLGTKSKILLALTLLAVVVGSALFLRRDTPVAHPSRTAPPTVSINQGSPPEPTEIAVLFFDNASGDPSIEWIRTALPDMLVTDLSQSPQISVLSTSRVYQAVDDLEPLASGKLSLTLLEALLERIASIDRIVLGQLFQVGPTLHVEARMQSAQGEILDSWSFEGKGEESLFEIADRLSLEIRQGIEISNALGRLPDRDIADITTGSVDALRAYIAGLTDHMRYDEKAAFDHFLKAVDLDPEFTLAWAKLAITARNLSRPEAFEYAQRALADADRLSSQERDYIVGFTAGQDTRRWREAVEARGRADAPQPGGGPPEEGWGSRFVRSPKRSAERSREIPTTRRHASAWP